MAISFVGSTHVGGVTVSGTEPSGTQPGDVLLAVINANAAPTGPAGWTKIGTNVPQGSGWVANVWIITRGASAPSLTWSGTSFQYLDISCWRGAKGTPNVTGQGSTGSNSAPSVTTTVANAMLVCLFASYDGSTPGAPSGMTDRTASGKQYNCIASLSLGAAGATGSKTFTGSTLTFAGWSVALEPDLVAYSGGSQETSTIVPSGDGSPGPKSTTSQTEITLSISASGSPAFSAGSSVSVDHTESGVGSPGAVSETSQVSSSVSVDGSGSPSASSSTSQVDISLTVSASGSPGFYDGSSTEINVSTVVGGSVSVVTVVATGAGVKTRVDMDFLVGSSLVLQRDVGPSRTGYSVGASRLDR